VSLSHRQPMMVAKPYTLRGGVVYRIQYFALPGCQQRRAAIYVERAPFLELKSGPMTSALGTFETCRRTVMMPVYRG
jgi:hypothetical protein